MATINQSPANQSSITLSGIDLTGITATTITPFRQNRKTVDSPSVAINFGGGGPSVPTVGQIWPLGII